MEGSQLNNFTQEHKGNVQVEFIASDRYCQSSKGLSVNQQPVLLKIKLKKNVLWGDDWSLSGLCQAQTPPRVTSVFKSSTVSCGYFEAKWVTG